MNFYDRIDKIRKAYTDYEIKLSKNVGEHFCSALDICGDAFCALDEYLHLDDKGNDTINYIYIYGAVHLMGLQMQATKLIYELVLNRSMDLTKDEQLDSVRVLRNKFFSHPFEQEQHTGSSYGIVRASLSTFKFQPYAFTFNIGSNSAELSESEKINAIINRGENHLVIVDMKKLIENHYLALNSYLDEVCQHLDAKK